MIKKIFFFVIFISVLFQTEIIANSVFDDFFLNRTFRIDFYHSGNAKNEYFSIDKLYLEGKWSGNKKSLIFPFKYGKYRYEIYSYPQNILKFSKGYDSYFAEYSTTQEAINGVNKTCLETALIPFPRGKFFFVIKKKDRKNIYHEIFKTKIDPRDRMISTEKKYGNAKIINILKSGDPEKCVDLAFIAEGYQASEFKKAKADFMRAKEIFFSQEPYKSLRSRFNLYGIFKASFNSGTDEPRQQIFKNTAVDTTFNSFNSPRYLLTESNKKLRDISSAVPYDAIIIMVNSKRYGGGGIFNLYCTFTIDNKQTPYLLLHEFGHSFSGLADEYYSSAVSYNDFYPPGIEPDEPNITALLNPKNLKWRKLITAGVKIPTPWRKTEFDRMNADFSKKRAKINRKIEALIKKEASPDQISAARKELNDLINKKEIEDKNFFLKSGNRGIIGAFEGAGYSSKGLYRSMTNCIMFTIGKKPYCKVCRSAVEEMIKYYSD